MAYVSLMVRYDNSSRGDGKCVIADVLQICYCFLRCADSSNELPDPQTAHTPANTVHPSVATSMFA